MTAERGASLTLIDVLQPDDVVLAEIASGLHLDQLEWNLAGVGEAMHGADRDIDRFVLMDDAHGLGAVTSAVPRTTIQCSARCMCFCRTVVRRLDDDALDLKPIADVDRLEMPHGR